MYPKSWLIIPYNRKQGNHYGYYSPISLMKKISKEAAEAAILERFMITYQKRFGHAFTRIKHQDKPDFAVRNPITKERIGIEVTSVYQNDKEARIQNGAAEPWDEYETSIDELLLSINTQLSKKARKSKQYMFNGRMFLVIWLGSLAFNQKTDMDLIRPRFIIPKNQFAEIWLIITENGDDSPLLYPLQTRPVSKPQYIKPTAVPNLQRRFDV